MSVKGFRTISLKKFRFGRPRKGNKRTWNHAKNIWKRNKLSIFKR